MTSEVFYTCLVKIEPIREDLLEYAKTRITELKDEEGFRIVDLLSFEYANFMFYTSSVIEATRIITLVLLELNGIIEAIGIEISRIEE